jgi:hypothetical protein
VPASGSENSFATGHVPGSIGPAQEVTYTTNKPWLQHNAKHSSQPCREHYRATGKPSEPGPHSIVCTTNQNTSHQSIVKMKVALGSLPATGVGRFAAGSTLPLCAVELCSRLQCGRRLAPPPLDLARVARHCCLPEGCQRSNTRDLLFIRHASAQQRCVGHHPWRGRA